MVFAYNKAGTAFKKRYICNNVLCQPPLSSGRQENMGPTGFDRRRKYVCKHAGSWGESLKR